MNDESVSKGRYLIRDPIGLGGVGQVFRAWDQHLERAVAIKRIRTDIDMEASIRREASILAGLHHPNIVTIFDFATDEVGPFAVMEYVEGSTLDQAIANGPLSLTAFVELANQVCRGLSAAHASGLVHLDLKAGNLMLQYHEDGSFTCKILDFGLAHLHHEAKADDPDGSIFGSPYTIAPEQLLREPVDARTDLYSLGCVFYLALSGREPFTGEKVSEVLNRHLNGEATPLHFVAPGVPGPISSVLSRMMARQPADRPESAEEVRRLIQSANRAPSAVNRGRSPVPVPFSAAPAITARPAKKGGPGVAILVLLLLVLAAGGFFYARSMKPVAVEPDPTAVTPTAAIYPTVDPLDAKAVAQYRGQTVSMAGMVTSVGESSLFGARYLKFSNEKSDAAVLSLDESLLSLELAGSYVGKKVTATGTVSTAANQMRLVVASLSDIKTSQ